MANVDPFVIEWPRKWLADREIEPVIRYMNRFLHDLFIRTGGGVDIIEKNQINIDNNEVSIFLLDQFRASTQPQINDIRAKIGSGDFLTSDETGFTVDSTKLSVDMTES